MSLLEVSDLESGYGKVPVLHGVSLRVDPGEIVAVVGPNGAGKSTLMKTIFGLLPVMGGAMTFDGQDLTRVSSTHMSELGAGYVPQGSNTFPDLSVEDNLRVAMPRAKSGDLAAAQERVFENFPVLGERRRQRAKTLSGGERQMLALATATMTQPRFLALDEPTTGLAPSIVQHLIRTIVGLRDTGATVLWVVEESPLQILEHVNRVYLLQSGVIARELEARELLENESLQELFFGATV